MRPADAALIGTLALLSIVAQGHHFGVGNNAVYIAWMWRLGPRALFLNDWYLNTAALHPHVVYPLIRLNGVLALDWTFFLAHTITRVIFAGGVYLLGWWNFRDRTAAALGVVFSILFPRISLGGHFAQSAIFEAGFLGFALAALTLALFVQSAADRRALVPAGIGVGLTLHFHFFIGATVAVIVALVLLQDIRRGAVRIGQAAGAGTAALVFGAASFYHVFQSWLHQDTVLSASEVAEILMLRHPHHHSPFTWPLRSWLSMGGYTALWWVLMRVFPAPSRRLEMVLIVWTLVTSALFTVFTELIPYGPIAYFQCFRQTVFFTIFCPVYMGRWAAAMATGGAGGAGVRRWTGAAMAAALLVTFRFPAVFLPLAAVGLFWSRPRLRQAAAARTGDLLENFAFSRRPGRAAVWAALGSAVLLWAAAGAGALNPLAVKVFGRPHVLKRIGAGDEALADACGWIRTHTPPGAVFLIPPDIESFRILAERACVVDWKSVPFENRPLWEWFDRFARTADLAEAGARGRRGDSSPPDSASPGLSPASDDYSRRLLDGLAGRRVIVADFGRSGFERLSEDELLSIARRFGAGFILTRRPLRVDSGRSATMIDVYANAGYRIYRLAAEGP
ncbi:MAG: hypothetical protein Kow0059_06760 [Candidatus Sumerlaeia bacterium]